MEWFAMCSYLIGILTFIFGIFHYVVLKPLNKSILELRGLIDKIQHNVEEDERVRHKLEIEVATIKEKLHQIDTNYGAVTRYCMTKLYGHE